LSEVKLKFNENRGKTRSVCAVEELENNGKAR
jgi:hypothetical protein